LHAKIAGWVNRLDQTPQRKVWYNYRETALTFRLSYLARLNYVHQNPVKHGLVPVASLYPWCSAAWFENTAPAATVKSISRFRMEALRVDDDFEPCGEW